MRFLKVESQPNRLPNDNMADRLSVTEDFVEGDALCLDVESSRDRPT